jgi:predicted ester cyclase
MEKSARNKSSYLQAKEAFNRKDIEACIFFYSPDHEVKSKQSKKGRDGIKAFFESMHDTWADLQITVEHVVAEGNWVMGRSVAVATHSKTVLGATPTNKKVMATFWDLHHFDNDGLIIETWNLMDNLAIMQQVGLLK